MESLAAFPVPHPLAHGARLPVQSVIRTPDHRRGYQGMLQGGRIRVGDWLHAADAGEAITVTEIYHSGRAVKEALPGQAITVLTEQDVDLSRGNVLYAPDAPMQHTDAFTADLLWLDPAFAHRNVTQGILKVCHREEQVEVHIDDTTPTILEAKIYASAPFVVDAYQRNRTTGLFMLIQSETEKVIGIGTVKSLQGQEWNFSI
jgi:bifunctional enzyme CysN/CysC